MNFFGIGPFELAIIVVVALLIFGPGKLPEVAGQVGRAVRDFRKMTAELTGEFEKTMSVADDIKNSVRAEVTNMTKEVTSVADSVKRDLGEATDGLSGAVKTATAKAAKSDKDKNETGAVKAKSTRETKVAVPKTVPVASKADPLADVSLMDDDLPVVKSNGRKSAPVPVAKKESAPAPATAVAAAPKADSPVVVGKRDEMKVETIVNGKDETVIEDVAVAAATNGGVPGDALARARQRRQAAGYNRRIP